MITLTGNSTSHHIYGGAGNDHLNGGSGDDIINGQGGADAMAGGDGTTRISSDNIGDTVAGRHRRRHRRQDLHQRQLHTRRQRPGRIPVRQRRHGTDLDRQHLQPPITGGGGADHLNGGTGNDIINGGLGADVMAGGDGGDTYFVDNAGDQVVEGPGGGTAHGLRRRRRCPGAGRILLRRLGQRRDAHRQRSVQPSPLWRGRQRSSQRRSRDDTINGLGGADTMAGGKGNDLYLVDNANDVVIEAADGGTSDKVYASVDYKLTAGSLCRIAVRRCRINRVDVDRQRTRQCDLRRRRKRHHHRRRRPDG